MATICTIEHQLDMHLRVYVHRMLPDAFSLCLLRTPLLSSLVDCELISTYWCCALTLARPVLIRGQNANDLWSSQHSIKRAVEQAIKMVIVDDSLDQPHAT